MKRKIIKFVIFFIIIISINTICHAEKFDPGSFEATYGTNISDALDLGRTILGWITNIAAVSLVILIAFLGLKFMLGSVEQRAEYKKSFMPLIIGTCIVVGAAGIMSFVWNFNDSTDVSVQDSTKQPESNPGNDEPNKPEQEQTNSHRCDPKLYCSGGKCMVCGNQVPMYGHIRDTKTNKCKACGQQL